MTNTLIARVKWLAILPLLMLAIHVSNVLLGGQLNQLGIVPRVTGSLLHVFTAPFIHSSFEHLFSNLVVLVVFSAFCLVRSVTFYFLSSLFIIVFSGLLVWIFGRTAHHIGASGWVFGLWGLSIAMAWFDRKLWNIALLLVVIVFYRGLVFGLWASDPRVSYEAHLAGVVAGVLWAYFYTRFQKRTPKTKMSGT
jgi:membrane associated rhomboid family serine protease